MLSRKLGSFRAGDGLSISDRWGFIESKKTGHPDESEWPSNPTRLRR